MKTRLEVSKIIFLDKKTIIRKKMFLKYLLSKPNSDIFKVDKNKRKIIVALAADYGNLGDVAITYAQTKFLKSYFPEYEIIDFPISRTFLDMKSLKKVCTPQDIITIVGGGNTGDMYDDIEYCRQFIIEQFPENKIISFPQTIDFSNTKFGEKALKKAISVYRSKNKNLILSAREKTSFKKYETYFSKNVLLFLPDIVLFLNEKLPKFQREDITLCLRSDGEKEMDQSLEQVLIDKLKEKYNVRYYDTHINKNNLSVEEREFELNKIWTAFKKSKLVITDRLHGMIFCAITKTPCIAIDNSNRKISGVYNAWLNNLGFIKMLEQFSIDMFENMVDELMDIDQVKINENNLASRFQQLVRVIESENKELIS